MLHNELEITAIQRLCLHDGPGVRTTVFLKGCLLDCPWCCNAETKYGVGANYSDGTTISYKIDVDALFEKIVADRDYYGVQGGVTFSGGEPLLWGDKLAPLCDKLQKAGVGVYVETSLFAPFTRIESIKPFVDGFIVDVKIIGSPFLNGYVSKSFDFHRNLIYLCRKVKLMRMVLIDGVTDAQDNISRFKSLVDQINPPKVEFLQYHSLGNKKAERLGLTPLIFECSNPKRIAEILAQFPESRYITI